MQALSLTLALKSIVTFPPLPSAPGMKFAFEIKKELVMQAAIIVAVVAFSSGSLAMIATLHQQLDCQHLLHGCHGRSHLFSTALLTLLINGHPSFGHGS
jgi:hypothetical protein